MNKPKDTNPRKKADHTLLYIIEAVAAIVLVLAIALFVHFDKPAEPSASAKKLNLLGTSVVTADVWSEIGSAPAGNIAKNVVFLSVSNGQERATVFHGSGSTLEQAWDNAAGKTLQYMAANDLEPYWVKADVVCATDTITKDELNSFLAQSLSGNFRFGLAFDPNFNIAILEEDLNSALIYDYENDEINDERLADYFKYYGLSTAKANPDTYTAFQCTSWFCDENSKVYKLCSDKYRYGRRETYELNETHGVFAANMISTALDYLVAHVNDDGSFVYELFPPVDEPSDAYNNVRHAGTVWAMIEAYRTHPTDEAAKQIEKAVGYMCDHISYDLKGNAYLYDEVENEISLGGSAIAVLALTEYENTFNNKDTDICTALGNGILEMFDETTGEYYHILNRDFSHKEKFRTVYYDGEATFALCRLYEMTGEKKWLDAAQKAVQHFIDMDYTQYCDHWVAYSMNEITKYFPENQTYYEFALKNVSANTVQLSAQHGTAPVYLELLMSTFELYERMLENGISVNRFDADELLSLISLRVECQLNAFFFPEYAMYMKNPQRILNTFMTRSDNFRIRIDDVQHNIGGFYLYLQNYDALIAAGMTPITN